ncbi:MAG TPA: DUF3850 domain-containing protein [Patescibacteria group bacterium]|nr:DUF3850 domain-containing protein [Patescibacteria group bacterium]
MRTIEKKVLAEYYDALLDGTKTFELRIADFECEPGDKLILKEWDPTRKQYTGRELQKEATYVLITKDIDFLTNEDINTYGYQVISLK